MWPMKKLCLSIRKTLKSKNKNINSKVYFILYFLFIKKPLSQFHTILRNFDKVIDVLPTLTQDCTEVEVHDKLHAYVCDFKCVQNLEFSTLYATLPHSLIKTYF